MVIATKGERWPFTINYNNFGGTRTLKLNLDNWIGVMMMAENSSSPTNFRITDAYSVTRRFLIWNHDDYQTLLIIWLLTLNSNLNWWDSILMISHLFKIIGMYLWKKFKSPFFASKNFRHSAPRWSCTVWLMKMFFNVGKAKWISMLTTNGKQLCLG